VEYSHRMVDAVIDEIDGRRIRIGDHWLVDFASCNYLGLDLDADIIGAIPEYLGRWGTHPSWSRYLGSPALYEEIEEQLAALLGVEDTLLVPTITHIHMSVIPVLAGSGSIFLDGRAHKTIYDGCIMARGLGATIERFPHNGLEELETKLAHTSSARKLIVTDGVNSMTGNAPDLPALARLAGEYDALLYVDDAHGFGVVGERSIDEPCDYGIRGNSVVRHLGATYENLVLVGGFSKAYSSLLAFIAGPASLKELLKTDAAPYLYSGPSPVASLATALEGLRANERKGDLLRSKVHRLTHRVLDRLAELDIATPNESGYPIIEISLVNADDLDQVGDYLFDRGIYVTIAPFPMVPKHEVGFRVQMTAANTDAEVDHLNDTLGQLAERFPMRARKEHHTPTEAR
jgi:8-amino-7-oxononanoate synthase